MSLEEILNGIYQEQNNTFNIVVGLLTESLRTGMSEDIATTIASSIKESNDLIISVLQNVFESILSGQPLPEDGGEDYEEEE